MKICVELVVKIKNKKCKEPNEESNVNEWKGTCINTNWMENDPSLSEYKFDLSVMCVCVHFCLCICLLDVCGDSPLDSKARTQFYVHCTLYTLYTIQLATHTVSMCTNN